MGGNRRNQAPEQFNLSQLLLVPGRCVLEHWQIWVGGWVGGWDGNKRAGHGRTAVKELNTLIEFLESLCTNGTFRKGR